MLLSQGEAAGRGLSPAAGQGAGHGGPEGTDGDKRENTGHPAPNLALTLILTVETPELLFWSLFPRSAFSDHVDNMTGY